VKSSRPRHCAEHPRKRLVPVPRSPSDLALRFGLDPVRFESYSDLRRRQRQRRTISPQGVKVSESGQDAVNRRNLDLRRDSGAALCPNPSTLKGGTRQTCPRLRRGLARRLKTPQQRRPPRPRACKSLYRRARGLVLAAAMERSARGSAMRLLRFAHSILVTATGCSMPSTFIR